MIGSALKSHLENLGQSVNSVDIDLTKIKSLAEVEYLMKQSDYVYFLAFNTGNSFYRAKKDCEIDFLNANLELMKNVFNLLKKIGTPFLFVSTHQTLNPRNSYDLLKALGEQYTAALNGTTVRLWNVYGPQSNLNKTSVINDFIQKALKHGCIKLETSGHEKRQFLYVKDCAEALYTIASEQFPDGVIDVSSGKWTSILEIAEIVSDYTGCTVSFTNTTVQNKLIEPSWSNLSDCWKPKYTLKGGIFEILKRSQT